MTEHEVVIAGGGPTGLMLAGELALADGLQHKDGGDQSPAPEKGYGIHVAACVHKISAAPSVAGQNVGIAKSDGQIASPRGSGGSTRGTPPRCVDCNGASGSHPGTGR